MTVGMITNNVTVSYHFIYYIRIEFGIFTNDKKSRFDVIFGKNIENF